MLWTACSPHKFVYSGTRSVRGIPADVWTAERSAGPDSSYSTLEIFFADPAVSLQGGEGGPVRSVPVNPARHIL